MPERGPGESCLDFGERERDGAARPCKLELPDGDDGPEALEACGEFARMDVDARGFGDECCDFIPVVVGLRHEENAGADDQDADDEVEPDGELHDRLGEAELRREVAATSVADRTAAEKNFLHRRRCRV